MDVKKLIVILLFVTLFSTGANADFEGLYFRGYKCTEDCSGHIAGYNWAIEKSLTSPNQCSGRSNSFIEGCISLFNPGSPQSVTLVEFKKSKNFAIGCVGSSSVGGPCYDGVGGPLYDGVGGPLYDGVGGPLYDGVGGPLYDGVGGDCYDGVGGNCYEGYGGDMRKCPLLCR